MGGGGGGQAGPTRAMTAQQQINAQLWKMYSEQYQPLINKYAQMETSPGGKVAEEKLVAGQINAEMMKNLPAGTINPVATAENLAGMAGMESSAQVRGQGKVRQRQIGDIENIINIGRGQATTAQAGMGQEAARSLQEEIWNKQMEQEERAATENMIGSIAGTIAGGVFQTARRLTPKQETEPTSPFELVTGERMG